MSIQGEAALRVAAITKAFEGVHALRGVDLEVGQGEVHAIVGENGAGKSTLVSIAAGELAADNGTVHIGGSLLESEHPREAQTLGLAHVHQRPALAPDLTVAENLYLGVPRDRRPRVRDLDTWAAKVLAGAEADIRPEAEAGALQVAERHLVEIAKALWLNPRVLVLDEPTEFLDAPRVDLLFAQIRRATAKGTGVVYVSHRVREVKSIASRLTVLRDGVVRGSFTTDDVSEDEIVDLIVGRPIDTVFPDKGPVVTDAPVALQARGLSGPGFHSVDLNVARGEIVGIGGIEGNGQRELLRTLAGVEPGTGDLEVAGKPLSLGNAARGQARGIVYVPPDRHAEGLFKGMSVRANATVLALPDYTTSGVMRRRAERIAASDVAQRMAVVAPSVEADVATLSGGNQQKVMMARAKLATPTVLLVDEPTQGVDAAGRVEIFKILRNAAAEGVAVVVAAADARELAGLCDRVAIFSRGEAVSELRGDDVTEANITGAALRSTALRTSSIARKPPARIGGVVSRGALPSVVLGLLIVALGIYATTINASYLTAGNFQAMLLLVAAAAFVGMGQLIAIMIGLLDLSLGPLAGLLVVVGSFFFTGDGTGSLLLGLVVLVAVCALVGAVNGGLTEGLHINPVVATLATFFVLQGVSLTLRPRPAGPISTEFIDGVSVSIGAVPVAFIVAVVLAIALQYVLRRTRVGMEIRSIGSDAAASSRIGLRVGRTRVLASVACAVCCLGTGILLMTQVGIGDATTGSSYTLTSITAVLLGGAAITGGRGSFIGTLLGALTIQQVVVVNSFLNLSQAWGYWLLGALALAAVITYSRGARAEH